MNAGKEKGRKERKQQQKSHKNYDKQMETMRKGHKVKHTE
jgi:hypothetical protein